MIVFVPAAAQATVTEVAEMVVSRAGRADASVHDHDSAALAVAAQDGPALVVTYTVEPLPAFDPVIAGVDDGKVLFAVGEVMVRLVSSPQSGRHVVLVANWAPSKLIAPLWATSALP